jgi:signal transduction histidine kinase/ligand-binding sensor domain-containing protein
MDRRRLLIFFISLLLPFSSIFCQQIRFREIDINSEKLSSIFLDLSQDPMGYIWLSSFRSGIFRYDGREFINYSHNDSNSNSLISDVTPSIHADAEGIVWIGTLGSGLDRFDPFSHTFTHFRHEPGNNSSICNDSITVIKEDREGNILLGTCGGFSVYHKESRKFTNYFFNPKDSTSLSYNWIRTIYQDHRGTIWIGCGYPISPGIRLPPNGGLNRFNPEKGNFTRYQHEPGNENSLESNLVGALFEDSKGNFWVGTMGDGLHIMNREKGTFTHYYYDSLHPEKLSRPPVYATPYDFITFITEDSLGGIWIGSFLSGINRFDTLEKKITHFGIIPDFYNKILKRDTSEGFYSRFAWHGLITSDGLLWISGAEGNHRLYSASVENKTVPFFPLKDQGGANTFFNEDDSIVWIGADSGLIRKNIKTQAGIFYGPDTKNFNCRIAGSVTAIRRDKDHHFWLGTFNGGLFKYVPEAGVFTRFKHDNNRITSLGNDSIQSMWLDHADNLWIGTLRGLDKLDPKTGEFKHYFKGSTVFCIREDQNHTIWAGTNNELFRLDEETGNVTIVLPNARVASICADANDGLWIGADTARNVQQNSIIYQILYHFDRSRNKFILYRDPVTNDKITSIFDIMQDKDQHLWVSTTNAIYEINRDRTEVKKLGANHGVHLNDFTLGDNLASASGLLFFGDSRGYYSFYPGELKDNSTPQLNFTGLKLNGKEVLPGTDILKTPLWKSDEIRLSYSQNSFSIEFAGINYRATSDVKYQVKLENYDDSWRENNTEKKAFYFNVPPGRYVFHVKAYNSEGGISEKSIGIIITPPWWKTWWAYTLFTLAALGIISGYINYRSRKLLNENRQLEEKVSLRTNQLNQSLENLKSTQTQLIQSEKMASLGELTAGIAHEIQNPLNFVNNFSDINNELIEEMREQIKQRNFEEVENISLDIKENEKKINHHGKRADAIVKGMLEHSRSNSGIREMTDLNALADEYLRLCYHGLRARNKFLDVVMETDFDPAVGKINLVPQDFGRVLLNLFNNAFYSVGEKKQTLGEGFKPIVSVSTRKNKSTVLVIIRDNGTGIPKNIQDKILQPFFTTKPTGSGTGLGLSLSYDIIKAHRGELKIESEEGEGATFIISLPAE